MPSGKSSAQMPWPTQAIGSSTSRKVIATPPGRTGHRQDGRGARVTAGVGAGARRRGRRTPAGRSRRSGRRRRAACSAPRPSTIGSHRPRARARPGRPVAGDDGLDGAGDRRAARTRTGRTARPTRPPATASPGPPPAAGTRRWAARRWRRSRATGADGGQSAAARARPMRATSAAEPGPEVAADQHPLSGLDLGVVEEGGRADAERQLVDGRAPRRAGDGREARCPGRRGARSSATRPRRTGRSGRGGPASRRCRRASDGRPRHARRAGAAPSWAWRRRR